MRKWSAGLRLGVDRVERLPLGQPAPPGRGAEQMADRVDLVGRSEQPPRVRHTLHQLQQQPASVIETRHVVVGMVYGPSAAASITRPS